MRTLLRRILFQKSFNIYQQRLLFGALATTAAGTFFALNNDLNDTRDRFRTIYKHFKNASLVPSLKPRSVLYAKEKSESKENSDKKNIGELLENPRKTIFLHFASVEYNGVPYMTPHDFIESVTGKRLTPNTRRKILSQKDIDTFAKSTPRKKKGSKNLFRGLENKGLISYSEYLFLLCVITKPKSSFEIAFNMFDMDGNKTVDKKEFLVIEKAYGSGDTNVETAENDENVV